MDQKPFYLQKTFWAGMGVILTGVLALFTNVLTPEQTTAIITIFGGLTAIFLRDAVKTK